MSEAREIPGAGGGGGAGVPIPVAQSPRVASVIPPGSVSGKIPYATLLTPASVPAERNFVHFPDSEFSEEKTETDTDPGAAVPAASRSGGQPDAAENEIPGAAGERLEAVDGSDSEEDEEDEGDEGDEGDEDDEGDEGDEGDEDEESEEEEEEPLPDRLRAEDVRIRGHERIGEGLSQFTAYRVDADILRADPETPEDFSSADSEAWSVLRRYSDFHILHQILTETHPQCLIPPLPEKTVLTRLSKATVDDRQVCVPDPPLDHSSSTSPPLLDYVSSLIVLVRFLLHSIITVIILAFLANFIIVHH